MLCIYQFLIWAVAILGWETDDECVEHISATLEVLGTEIDLGVMSEGLDTGHKHSFVSMVSLPLL